MGGRDQKLWRISSRWTTSGVSQPPRAQIATRFQIWKDLLLGLALGSKILVVWNFNRGILVMCPEKEKSHKEKKSLIVRKKDWIGRVKVLWNKRGTCIFAYLPKICKTPAMHFTSFCIELELNIHSPIAQETPRSSILLQHHASS